MWIYEYNTKCGKLCNKNNGMQKSIETSAIKLNLIIENKYYYDVR